MALYYQTQYRLGRRGRVCRSYTGFQAFVAILFDLVFGLIFEVVASVFALAFRLMFLSLGLAVQLLKITWSVAIAVMTVVVSVLTLPFAILHQLVTGSSSSDSDQRDANSYHQESSRKPEWAFSREV